MSCGKLWALRRDKIVTRATAAAAVTLLLAAVLTHRALAADAPYPSHPVRIVVAFPPGGPVDTIARALAEKLSRSLGQPFVVENKPGATGLIGTNFVAKAPPDGYTLLMGASTIPIQATLNKSLPYDTLHDLTPISMVGDSPLLLVVNPSVQVTNLGELVQYVKANSGKLSYGSAGSGSANHLGSELMKAMTGMEITHVPYKGAAPAELDVMAGRVVFILDAFTTGWPLVQSGRLRALAVTSLQRSSVAPNIPTMAESGLPGFNVTTWYGLFGPGNLPPTIASRLHDEVNKALALPDIKARLAGMGLEVRLWTTAQFGAFMKTEVEKWARVIKQSGAQAD